MTAVTPTQPTTLNHARITQIAQQIRGAVTPFTAANVAKVLASEDAQSASKAEVSLRETIMVSVAELSQVGQWTHREINLAASKAAAMNSGASTNSDKALATFIGETKRAMDPKVRSHVGALVSLRDQCWDAETEIAKADKNAPTPMRKAFARKYHMLTALMGAVQEGMMFASVNDVLVYAEDVVEKAKTNTDRVLARLGKIVAELVNFHQDFPVDDISVCIEALQAVDKRALNVARGTVKVTPTNVVPITPVNVPVNIPETSVADGASDILEDILEGDSLSLQAA